MLKNGEGKIVKLGHFLHKEANKSLPQIVVSGTILESITPCISLVINSLSLNPESTVAHAP